MQAVARHLRITDKKINLVAGLVRQMSVVKALDILKFTPKKAAPIIAKVIKSAAANATNNLKQDINDLYIKEIIVNEGATLKRSVPISRGRVHPIAKGTCHITIKLEVKGKEEPKVKTTKVEEAKTSEPKVEVKEVKAKKVTKKTT